MRSIFLLMVLCLCCLGAFALDSTAVVAPADTAIAAVGTSFVGSIVDKINWFLGLGFLGTAFGFLYSLLKISRYRRAIEGVGVALKSVGSVLIHIADGDYTSEERQEDRNGFLEIKNLVNSGASAETVATKVSSVAAQVATKPKSRNN